MAEHIVLEGELRAYGPFPDQKSAGEFAGRDWKRVRVLHAPRDPATRVQSLLDALPKSSREIAGFFFEIGVKGKTCASRACPVYEYLTRYVPEVTSVSYGTIGLGAGKFFATPPHVESFLRDFDAIAAVRY